MTPPRRAVTQRRAQPFFDRRTDGGTKDSGSGPRERGKAAREFLTETKTVYIHAP